MRRFAGPFAELLVHSGRFLSRLGVTAALLYLLIGTSFGLSLTADNLISSVRNQGADWAGILQGIAAIVIAIASCCWAWLVARRNRPYPVPQFILGLLVVATCARVMLVLHVDSQWSTDYLRYWQHALTMAASPQLSVNNLYDQRALLVAYPVAKLFGSDGAVALKLVNVALLTAIQLMAYDLMRLARNHQAAQAMSILLFAAPMLSYASLIPSHDLWGLFFLTVATWAACRAAYRPDKGARGGWLRIVGLVSICAVGTYCLELQRSIGTLFAMALCLAAGLSSLLRGNFEAPAKNKSSSPAVLIAVAVICLLMQPVLTQIGTRLEIHPATQLTEQSTHKMKFAAHAGAMGTATSDWYARFRDRFRDKSLQDPEAASEFARALALSTWVLQPQGKLSHIASHMPRMFDLGYPADWDTALRQPESISAVTRGSLVLYAGAFGVVFGLMLIAALAAATTMRCSPAPPILILALLLSALSFLLLVLFENKAPNIFPIWLVGSMLIAWVASFPAPAVLDFGAEILRRAQVLATAIFLLVIASGGIWLLGRMMYGEGDGLVLSGWDLNLQQSTSPPLQWEAALRTAVPRAFDLPYYEEEQRGFVLRGAPTDGARIKKYSGNLITILEFPSTLSLGDSLSMTRKVCGTGKPQALEFFVFSPLRRPDVTDAFSVDVAIDGASLKHIPIPLRDGSMQLVTIPSAIDGTGCHDVSMTLTANVAFAAASWRRASRTEIWFPRLTTASTR